MGPPIYDCPGLTLDELPWGEMSMELRSPLITGRQHAELLIGGYTYWFSRWLSGAVECERLAAPSNIEVFSTKPGDTMLAQALLIELTKGKTVQDPNL